MRPRLRDPLFNLRSCLQGSHLSHRPLHHPKALRTGTTLVGFTFMARKRRKIKRGVLQMEVALHCSEMDTQIFPAEQSVKPGMPVTSTGETGKEDASCCAIATCPFRTRAASLSKRLSQPL